MPPSDQRLDPLRRYARLLDDVFRIPGTNIRFGLDPLLGFVPGLGDLATPLFAAAVVGQGLRMRLPKVVLFRMVVNAGLDALVSLVPVAGDLFDVAYKANRRNLALLERHARPGVAPTRGDYLVVWLALGLLALLALASVAVFALLLWWLSTVRLQPL